MISKFGLAKKCRIPLFALALVLYEFTTNAANDMIMPAMPHVVQEFGAGQLWIPRALTGYIAGGALLAWFLGPLSDRIGRRPVLLAGVLGFILATIATTFVHTIEQFTILRVIQGSGVGFIGAVGYAAIHEKYDTGTALRIVAIMANVALIAPLIGPIAGGVITGVSGWRSIQYFIASLSILSLVGLYRTLPARQPTCPAAAPQPFRRIPGEYLQIFTNKKFLWGSLTLCLAIIPMVSWIGLSPIVLLQRDHFSLFEFGLAQTPIFGLMMLGNIYVAYASRKKSPLCIVTAGVPFLVVGGAIASAVAYLLPGNVWLLIGGIALYCAGLGILNAALTRMTLCSMGRSTGAISAALATTLMVAAAAGTEFFSHIYHFFGSRGFGLAVAGVTLLFCVCARAFIFQHREIADTQVQNPEEVRFA